MRRLFFVLTLWACGHPRPIQMPPLAGRFGCTAEEYGGERLLHKNEPILPGMRLCDALARAGTFSIISELRSEAYNDVSLRVGGGIISAKQWMNARTAKTLGKTPYVWVVDGVTSF